MNNRPALGVLTGMIIFTFVQEVNAQTVVFDGEITWEWPAAGNEYGGYGFYWWHQTSNPNFGEMPADDWLSPYDYFNGEFRMRFEVLEQPTDKPFKIQFGIWQDSNLGANHLEQVCNKVDISGGTVFDGSIGTPNDWWSLQGSGNELDFSRPGDFYRIGLVLWNPSPVCIPKDPSWGSDGCPQYKDDFFPMRARVTVTAIPESGPIINPPSYHVDYYNERTQEVVSSSDQWSRDNSSWTNGNNETLSLTPGEDVYFRKREDWSKTQTLYVPERPATPSYTVDFVNEQTSEPVPATDEYAASPDMSGAVAGSGSTLAITPGENLYLRTSATSSAFRSGIATLDVPDRPVITSEEGDTTGDDPFEATVHFFQAAAHLTAEGILITNGTVDGLQLTSATDTLTLYQAIISPLTEDTVSLQVQANAVDEGNFTSELFLITYSVIPPDYRVDYDREQTHKKVSASDQWSTDSATWRDGNNEPLSLTPGVDVYFRKKADHSKMQILNVKERPDTPAFTIDYFNECTAETVSSDYRYSGSSDMSGAVEGTDSPVDLQPGNELYFQKWWTLSDFRSEIQTLVVPERPATPSYSIDYINEQTHEPVPVTDEYAASPDMSGAVAGSGSTVGITPGENLYLRTSTTASAFSSGIATLDVPDRPVITSEEGDTTGDNPFEATVRFFQAAAHLTAAGILITNGTTEGLELTSASDTFTLYQATIPALAEGPVSLQVQANAVDEGNFTSDLFSITYLIIPPGYRVDYDKEQTDKKVSNSHQWSTDSVTWRDGNKETLSLTPGVDVCFRHKLDHSITQTLHVKERPDPPEFTIDFFDERTAETVSSDYRYSGSSDMSGAVEGTGSHVKLNPGNELYFQKWWTVSDFRSEMQTLVVPERPATPSYSIDFFNEQTTETVPHSDEYSTSPDMSGAVEGSGSNVAITPGENLYLRTSATASEFSSEIAILNVPDRPVITSDDGGTTGNDPFETAVHFFQAATHLTAAGISITNGTLEGLQLISAPGSGTSYQATISPLSVGTVSLQVQANAVDEGNFISDLFHITYSIVPPDYSVDYDKEQTNKKVSTSDQWSTDNATWTDGNNEYMSLTPGVDVYFRKKADHSKTQRLYVKRRPDTPEFTIDYFNERTAEPVTMDYWYATRSDMSDSVMASGSHLDLSPGHRIYFMKRWTWSTFRSEMQTLLVPERPATPSCSIDYMNEQTNEAVPATVEYSTAPDMSGAVAGSGSAASITPGENLYLRTRANSSAFSSGIQILEVPGRPVITSDDGGITGNDPFTVTIEFFYTATHLTAAGISVTNGTLERLQLSTGKGTGTLYQIAVSPLEEGIVSVQVLANAVDEGNFATLVLYIYHTGETGTRGLTGAEQLTLYPNPTTGLIRVSSPVLGEKGGRLEICSVTGKMLFLLQPAVNRHEMELDLGHLDPGVYILRLSSGSGSITRKVIIQGH